MRLFQRIGDIIAANLNDLVDRFEDPEVMLKQAIREMETMIEGATGGAARAIAGERLLARDLSDHERKAAPGVPRAEASRGARRRRSGPPGDRPRTRARGNGPGARSSSEPRPSRRRRPFGVRSPR